MDVGINLSGITITMSAPAIEAQLQRIGDILMAAKDDLTAAVVALNTSISAEIAAVVAKLDSFSGAVPAADAEAIVAQLKSAQSTLDTETAALAGTPVPPPPGP